MTGGQPPLYADENLDYRAVTHLRARGFNIDTAADVGLLGADDEAQLAYAAFSGRILLTGDRRDFRRLHALYVREGRHHAGIALLPSRGPLDRLVSRAVLLVTWFAAHTSTEPLLMNWNDLQLLLHQGNRPFGATEEEVRLALGLPPITR